MPAVEVKMPQLADSMEEGTIGKWLIEPGQLVAPGDELVEIETDKANMTYAAEAGGVLEIEAEEGATVAVGETIARLGDGKAAAVVSIESEGADSAPAASITPGAVDAGLVTEPDPQPSHRPQGFGERSAALATPLARRAAGIHDIALEKIAAGSGPGGRIVKADVLAAAGVDDSRSRHRPASPPKSSPAPRSGPASPVASGDELSAKGEKTVRDLSRLQAVIARRMSEAKATVPHFQVATEVAMDAALATRARLKESSAGEAAPSVNDLIVKAASVALRRHPKANGSYVDGRFELHGRINVGIAVAAEEGLVVPTIFDSDRKSLAEIGQASRRLAGRVRSGEVTPPELAGGTFTVSNLGMFGMTSITPVVNVPQAAILGVGMSREVLMRVGGEIVDTSLMSLTLSCDHRILYGAEAAEFLAEIKQLLEEPLLML
jgi:pyruvate dehydrogenase E2 component (dihydrolipoamide acetyltransferase)